MKVGQRTIGLHLRIQNVLPDVAQLAQKLGITIFQSFVSIKGSGKRLIVDDQQIKQFIALKDNFDHIFFHASYKINPSSCTISHHYFLEREVKLVERLGSPFLILHPGFAVGCEQRLDGIDALARTLNVMQKKYSSITFILENVAHGNLCVGCDIQDFGILLSKIEYPERVKFCIDTVHAFCYGYDIRNKKDREQFIVLLQDTISIENIMVLHINDTLESLASKQDQHAVLGKGNIGQDVLRAFAMHTKLAHIPIILELPELSIKEYKDILMVVKAWHLS